MRSVIYDSGDICALSTAHGGDKGIITFSSLLPQPLQDRPAATAKGFGDGVFARLGIDELHIVPRRNHWYQSQDMAEVERLARGFAGTRKVATYGSSMGGYGAALMSAQLGVPAIALSPQFTLDAGIAPWETRWREEAREIGAFDNGAMTRKGRASGYLFYDPFSTLDANQAAMFRERSDFIFVPCPFSGHATIAMVNRAYSLRRVVRDVLDETFSVPDFLAARRACGRTQDSLYMAALYVQAVNRRKPGVAAWAMQHLESLADRLNAKAIRTLYAFETRRGRKDLAEGWARAASALTPATAADCLVAARIAARADLHDEARRILRHGLTLAPANGALRRELKTMDGGTN